MSNWYLQSGNESDVVYSTRIRLARNIKGFNFVNRYTKNDSLKIIKLMENIIPKLGYGLKVIKLKDLDDITKLSLVENHLISPEFAYNKEEIGAIAINPHGCATAFGFKSSLLMLCNPSYTSLFNIIGSQSSFTSSISNIFPLSCLFDFDFKYLR